MLTLADLFIALLFASSAACLWRGHGIRERALALVRHHCEKMDVLLLDDNVALRRLSLLRDAHGRRRLARLGTDRRCLFHLAGELAEDLQRVLAGQPADADDQHNRGQAQALAATKAHPAATAADIITTGIDDVVTASAFFP